MIIQVKHDQMYGKGSYGLYFKLNSRMGVKLVVKSFRKKATELVSDLKSEDLNKVVQEATIGKIFNAKFTKGLCVVKYNKKYYLGILMKHEPSVTARKFVEKSEESSVFVSPQDKICIGVNKIDNKKNKNLHFWVKSKLWEKKIICSDENKNNVLVKKDKSLTIVDFDSSFNHFHGPKAEYYAQKNQLIKEFKEKNKKLLKKGKKG